MARSRSDRALVFKQQFLDDLRWFVRNEPRLAVRVLDLFEQVRRDPFRGVGKPEPLKRDLSGMWSRRVDDEHRVVYVVTDDRIDFLQARYHY